MSAVPALAAAAERLRGKPGRPRKPMPDATTTVVPPRLLDLQAAADYLGVSVWSIRDLEAAGTVRRVRVPMPMKRARVRRTDGTFERVRVPTPDGELRKLLFDREDLDALIARWKDGPP